MSKRVRIVRGIVGDQCCPSYFTGLVAIHPKSTPMLEEMECGCWLVRGRAPLRSLPEFFPVKLAPGEFVDLELREVSP